MQEEHPLEKEYQYFEKNKADLLSQYKDKFALIKDEKLAGTFDTDQDAYKAGLALFGNVPFLIVRIQENEEKRWIPVLSLGLLNATL